MRRLRPKAAGAWSVALAAIAALFMDGGASTALGASSSLRVISMPLRVAVNSYDYGVNSGVAPIPFYERVTSTPDGALWYITADGKHIARLSARGRLRVNALPAALGISPSAPQLSVGNDGAIRVAGCLPRDDRVGEGTLARVTRAGRVEDVVRYRLPPTGLPSTDFGGTCFLGLAQAADGAFWTTGTFNLLFRLAPGGELGLFFGATPDPGYCGLARGADGNVWVIENPYTRGVGPGPENNAQQIARISSDGQVTEFRVGPLSDYQKCQLTSGPSRSLWSAAHGYIVKTQLDGQVTKYPLIHGSGSKDIISLSSGPGRKIWFSSRSGRLGTVAANGRMRLYSDKIGPARVTAGPPGRLWAVTQRKAFLVSVK